MRLGGLGGDRDAAALHTERLTLRPPGRSDLDALDAAVHESVLELVRWLPWAHPNHARADSRRYIRGAQAARSNRTAFEFAIEERATQTLIGMASLHRIDWARRVAGLGYWVRCTCHGKGYATEAASRLLRHAFVDLDLHRVEVLVAVDNHASHRVVANLGCRREGIARGSERVAGEYLDHVQYSMLASDSYGGGGSAPEPGADA